MKKTHTLIIDIGNSRVKYYFRESQESLLQELVSLDNLLETAELTIHLVSTAPSKNLMVIEDLKKCLGQSGLDIEIFDPLKQTQITNLYPGIGADRVIKLMGVQTLYPNYNLILFDFGTATTMSGLDASGRFIGGFISLGLRASLKALGTACENLDDLSDVIENLSAGKLGLDTNTAIVEGSYKAHLGLIKEWQAEAQKFLGGKTLSVCTGGQALLFKDSFDKYISEAEILNAAFNSPKQQNV